MSSILNGETADYFRESSTSAKVPYGVGGIQNAVQITPRIIRVGLVQSRHGSSALKKVYLSIRFAAPDGAYMFISCIP